MTNISDLETTIYNQRKELYILNNRCRLLSNKIQSIHDLDYYKSRLAKLCPKTPYRLILSNKSFTKEVEAIFNKKFKDCLPYYDKLLNERNQTVHKFTIKEWIPSLPPYQRKITNRSLSELARYEY